MTDLLKAEADAKPTGSLAAVDVINVRPTDTPNKYRTQLPLTMDSDKTHTTILQRMTELETLVKDGFAKLSSKLSNMPIPTNTISGGGRRKLRRKTKRRSKMRSK